MENIVMEEDISVVDLSWLPEWFSLSSATEMTVEGVVRKQDQLDALLEMHSNATASSFAAYYDSGGVERTRKTRAPQARNKYIGIQSHFSTVDRRIKQVCHFGSRYKPQINHVYTNGEIVQLPQKKIRNTKMVKCTAMISITYISVYLNYPRTEFSKRERARISAELRDKLKKGEQLEAEAYIH